MSSSSPASAYERTWTTGNPVAIPPRKTHEILQHLSYLSSPRLLGCQAIEHALDGSKDSRGINGTSSPTDGCIRASHKWLNDLQLPQSYLARFRVRPEIPDPHLLINVFACWLCFLLLCVTSRFCIGL